MRRISRRSFLKASSTLLAASSFSPQILAKGLKATRKIAVVGAGLACLTAAYKLRQKYPLAEIHLYEGSSRLGGRVYTKMNLLGEGMLTELGGESMDESHTIILGLAKELGIETVSIPNPNGSTVFISVYNGQVYRESDLNNALSPLADALKARRDDLDQITLAEYFDELQIRGWIRHMLDAACTAEYGLEPQYLSGENATWTFGVTKDHEGKDIVTLFPGDSGDLRLKGGNSGLTQALFDKTKKSMEFHSGHSLESVRALSSGSYKLSFRQGLSSVTANYDVVLITIPYSVLRDVELKIPMSDQRRGAITELAYGKNFKFLAGYTRNIWEEMNLPRLAMCTSPTQMSWDNAEWQKVQGTGRTYYFGGVDALKDLRSVDPRRAVREFNKSLEPAYPGLQTAFNGKAVKMIWPMSRWSKGSYSAFAPNYITDYFDVMSTPVGSVHFAGEHTSAEFGGFMNGAVESAIRAVSEI